MTINNYRVFALSSLAVILMLMLLKVQPIYAQKKCNELEQCIPIRNCPAKLAIITLRRKCGNKCVSPEEYKSQIIDSLCKPNSRNHEVCCKIEQTTSNHPSLNLLPSPNTCGFTNNDDRIVGGENAKLGDWPWMALLRGRDKQQSGRFIWYCGGVLISRRYILTAAHCLSEDGRFDLDIVRLGEFQLTKIQDRSKDGVLFPPVQDAKAEKIILHEKYHLNCFHCNDIALIRLRSNIQIQTGFIDAICLPTNIPLQLRILSEQFQGRNATAAGWGVSLQNITTRAIKRPDILQQVQIPLHNFDKCSTYNLSYPDPLSVICGGETGKATCKGDSGGPLIMSSNDTTQNYLIGITSLGPAICGSENSPAIYTKAISANFNYIYWDNEIQGNKICLVSGFEDKIKN